MRNNVSTRSIFFVLLFFLFSCKGQNNPECLIKLKEKLSPKVNAENKIGEVINLKEDTQCFDWDSLLIMMPISLNKEAEKELGMKLPIGDDFTWESDNTSMFLFVKNKKVVYSMLQKATVDRETYDTAQSIKAYYFLNLLNSYGKGKYYVIIPKEKAVFETYPMVYHDKNGKEMSNPKFGLGVKIKGN